MISDKIDNWISEDDSNVTSEEYLKLSPEELEKRADELFEEMKSNPQKKEPVECGVKFFI